MSSQQEAPKTTRQQIVEAAILAGKDAAGMPYTTHGRTTTGFDCSGFVTYVYKKVFPDYVHMNTDVIESTSSYRKAPLAKPGDLIFFPKGINPFDKKSYPNHVGIMLDSQHWIGSQSSTGVARVALTNAWWSARTKYFLQYSTLTQ